MTMKAFQIRICVENVVGPHYVKQFISNTSGIVLVQIFFTVCFAKSTVTFKRFIKSSPKSKVTLVRTTKAFTCQKRLWVRESRMSTIPIQLQRAGQKQDSFFHLKASAFLEALIIVVYNSACGFPLQFCSFWSLSTKPAYQDLELLSKNFFQLFSE